MKSNGSRLIIFFILSLFPILNSEFAPASDAPAVHGMLLVGAQTLYLSHLPMFHSPHDYQIILEVTLHSSDRSPQAVYANDRLKTHERIYTLVPDQVFVLPAVVAQKKTFSATIFRGHFERGGTPILKGVIVQIQRVVYFHKFNPLDKPLSRLQYLLFGKGPELFMAHLIVTCPNFDQVVAIATAHPIPPARLMAPIFIQFPGRADILPLKENEIAQGEIGGSPQFDSFKVLGQFYFETGDLTCTMN